jgi:hypothetical protein
MSSSSQSSSDEYEILDSIDDKIITIEFILKDFVKIKNNNKIDKNKKGLEKHVSEYLGLMNNLELVLFYKVTDKKATKKEVVNRIRYNYAILLNLFDSSKLELEAIIQTKNTELNQNKMRLIVEKLEQVNTLKKNALDKFNNITFNVAVGKKKSSKKKKGNMGKKRGSPGKKTGKKPGKKTGKKPGKKSGKKTMARK